MNARPYIKALAAEGYIVLFALGVTHFPQVFESSAGPMFSIATVLSLLVFSVAYMGFIFFVDPLLFAIGGDVKGAVKHFIQTLLWFGLFAVVSAIGLFAFGV